MSATWAHVCGGGQGSYVQLANGVDCATCGIKGDPKPSACAVCDGHRWAMTPSGNCDHCGGAGVEPAAKPESLAYDELLERVKSAPPMTPEQLREQRISFAYGNAKLSNDAVTRGMVVRAVDEADAIAAAHPLRSGRHDLYETALRLVGERHDKGDLVELVTWLLMRAERPGGLTHDQIAVACKNVGVDLSCGVCAGAFYTGSGMGEHTCEEAEKKQ